MTAAFSGLTMGAQGRLLYRPGNYYSYFSISRRREEVNGKKERKKKKNLVKMVTLQTINKGTKEEKNINTGANINIKRKHMINLLKYQSIKNLKRTIENVIEQSENLI